MQFSTFNMELPLMRDMEATEQISLPGMFCTKRSSMQVCIINVMFLSLTADDCNDFQEQRNEI